MYGLVIMDRGMGMYKIKKYKKLENPRLMSLLFAMCWIAYFSTYLGRLNYSASLTEIVRSEGFLKGEAGMIGTAFFFAYGAGQLINGFLGDRLSPKWMIFTGILGSGICNLNMSLSHDIWIMTVIWCVNGFLQSLIWSPIIKIFSERIPEDKQKKYCIHINSSVPIGTFAAYAISALIIWRSNWQMVFLFSGVILVGIAIAWLIGMGKIDSGSERLVVPEEVKGVKKNYSADQTVSMWKLIAVSGLLFVCVSLMLQGILKDGVTTWIPTYISEVFHMGSAASIISTTVIPAFNLTGVYLAAFMNKKMHNEMSTAAFFFAVCTGAVFLLRIFSDTSVVLALFLFAIATTAMMAVNTMLVSVVPICFASYGKSSSISGLVNSCAYAGGALSTYGIGALSEVLGWNKTIVIWGVCALLGLSFCMAGRGIWKVFRGGRRHVQTN